MTSPELPIEARHGGDGTLQAALEAPARDDDLRGMIERTSRFDCSGVHAHRHALDALRGAREDVADQLGLRARERDDARRTIDDRADYGRIRPAHQPLDRCVRSEDQAA